MDEFQARVDARFCVAPVTATSDGEGTACADCGAMVAQVDPQLRAERPVLCTTCYGERLSLMRKAAALGFTLGL